MARTALKKQREANKRVVESRSTQMDVVEKAKHGKAMLRRKITAVNVVSLSFTITPEVDAIVSELALHDNVSRSHIVRQAVIFYAGARREQGTE